ncbi:MAG: hypothetical protein ACI4F7_08605 [Acutalibacteraceae bacterium]
MKKQRIKTVSLILAAVMLFSVIPIAAVGENPSETLSPAPTESDDADNGLQLSKTVSEPDENGEYLLELAAWADGSEVTVTVDKEIPTDIVLVLDQSGSMSQNYFTNYLPVYADGLNESKEYYVEYGDGYRKVEWCSRCNAWTYGCGGGGRNHQKGTEYTPKESESDTAYGRVQFYEYKTVRYDVALKNAVQRFADSVYEKAAGPDGDINTTDDNVNHRIAVVGFASGMTYEHGGTSYEYDYGNTELFVGGQQYTYNAGSNNSASHKNSAQSHYYEAFQDMSTKEGYNNVTASKNALDANGGTLTNLGIEMANGIFEANKIEDGERNRIVIVFTDGTPGWSGYDQNIANKALEQIRDTKTRYGAAVYTIGVFSGADAAINVSTDGLQASIAASDSVNRFMHYLSSNYMPADGKTAQTMESPGIKSFKTDADGKYTGESYYLSANDADTLNNIFESISGSITTGGSKIKLDKRAVLRDIISPCFALPEGTDASNIKVYTEDCTGLNTWSNRTEYSAAAVEIKDRTVNVTNFDYAENWVGTEVNDGAAVYRGRRLIVCIPIVVREGFLGGNGVVTNGEASGIYESADSAEAVENFISPVVDIEIKPVTVSAEDKNVYLSGALTGEQLLKGAQIKCGDVVLTDTLEPWQTAYVNIKYSGLSSFTSLEDDTAYTVSCTVEPKNEGRYTAQTGADTANINVFKPVLSFKDTEVWYGDSAPTSYASNKLSEEWRHGEVSAADADMTGEKPELLLSYQPVGGIEDGIIATKQDIPVTVGVKIGDTDIKKHTAFEHRECFPVCDFSEDKGEFLLHVKTCTLRVEKKGGEEGEPYIFYIYKDGKKYTELTVIGNGSTAVCELPVGTYTVKEDTGWSWRYKSSVFDKSSVTLSAASDSDTVKCTNSGKITEWLNCFSQAVKNIFGVSDNK